MVREPQPDWYILLKASQYIGVAPWELDGLPEPERTFWLHRGLMARNAEIEADNKNTDWAKAKR